MPSKVESNQRKKGRLLSSPISALMITAFIVAAVGAGYLVVHYSHAANCSVSATLVNSCRPWLGAAVRGYPQTTNDVKSQAIYDEQRINRPLDIVHTYHSVGSNTLSSDDTYFAKRANTYLYTNWKPASTWASISQNNSGIDSMAASIKSISPAKIFLTVWHEPENDVTYDPNCPFVGYKGSAGTPTDYRNMWSYVHNRFATDGVTNVVWVMNYMNYKPWQCLVKDMWPGNSIVDWVTFESYGSPTENNFVTKAGDMYNLLVADNDAAHDFMSKPWGIAEVGDCKSTSQAEVYSYYDQMKAALDSNAFPRLKMFMAYDDNGNNAGMGCLTEYDIFGRLDPTEQAHFNGFADDPRLTDAYYAPSPTPTLAPTPTPTDVPPTPPPTSGGDGSGSGGSDSGSGGGSLSGDIPDIGAGGNIESVDGIPMTGGQVDTSYLTNGAHTITVDKNGQAVKQTVNVNNKLNPYQAVRNFLFAGFHGNKVLMNAGMIGLIVGVLGAAAWPALHFAGLLPGSRKRAATL